MHTKADFTSTTQYFATQSKNWKPVVINVDKKEEIERRLLLIKNDLILNLNLQSVPSFFFGNLSAAIFLMEWAKHYPNERAEMQSKINSLVENSFKLLNDGSNLSFSYLEGIGGISWAFNQLKQNGFLDETIEESLAQLDQFVLTQAEKNILNDNNDLFYGSFGDLNYLVNRYNNKKIEESVLLNLINQLTNRLFKGPNNLVDNYEQKEINLGFAHGLAPFFVLLTRLANIAPHLKDECFMYFNKMRAFIAQFKQNESCYFTYPNVIENGKIIKLSPIRWCHGELSIAISFAMGSITFNDVSLREEAISIGLKTTSRRDLIETEISEFGICHGAAGNAHIYARLFNYTKIEAFQNTASYWIHQSLDMANYPDGLANYKVVASNNKAVNSINFLNGISGLGLAYFAAISELTPDWDNAIMLS